MDFDTIFWQYMFVGGVLWLGRCRMLEFVEDVVDVAGHGHLGRAGGVVPGDCQATVELARPVGFDWVKLFQGLLKVKCILVILVSHRKVIDH